MPNAAYLTGLGHAEAVLARPHKARNVVRVYRLRSQDVAREIGDALLVFRSQRPQLAAGKGPVVVGLSLSPDHALAEHVAVGLVVVGRDAGAQPVSLIVAAQRAPAGLAFCHQSDTRLPRASVELTQRIGVGVLVRDGIESRRNIATSRLRAVNSFTRCVAARRNGDSLVVERARVVDRLLDSGCFVRDRGCQRDRVGLAGPSRCSSASIPLPRYRL